MTEQIIRDLAKRFGLEVHKRITTGTTKKHFATFELTGERCPEAWKEIGGTAFRRFGRPTNPDYPDQRPYIELESIWCDRKQQIRDQSERLAKEAARKIGASAWYENADKVLTDQEKAEIRSLWDSMNGSTSWIDAFFRWMQE